MPTHSSHTHCQAPQTNAQTQAWQRVCLPQRTTKPTDIQTDEREHRTHNITYTQAGVSCFVGQESGKFKVQFFVGSSVVKIPACV
ncbi:MAG: hypothetical protein RBS19_07725 [Bacteroidales bacterium]|nr:hypothetical protein [Bacteroidales bacterium]